MPRVFWVFNLLARYLDRDILDVIVVCHTLIDPLTLVILDGTDERRTVHRSVLRRLDLGDGIAERLTDMIGSEADGAELNIAAHYRASIAFRALLRFLRHRVDVFSSFPLILRTVYLPSGVSNAELEFIVVHRRRTTGEHFGSIDVNLGNVGVVLIVENDVFTFSEINKLTRRTRYSFRKLMARDRKIAHPIILDHNGQAIGRLVVIDADDA